jgi:hypothetical protein
VLGLAVCSILRLFFLSIFNQIVFAWAMTAFAGPPFLTDDPEPVPFKHWEIYLFSTIDVTRKSTNGTKPAVEFTVGPSPTTPGRTP